MHSLSNDAIDRTYTGTSGANTIWGANAPQLYFPQSWADYRIEGLSGNDVLIGGHGDDEIYGDLGNDLIAGNYGLNELFGGGGIDTLDYTRFGLNSEYIPEYLGVEVNMFTGITESRDNNLLLDDEFYQFENVVGSSYNDKIYGNNGSNDLEGRGGSDYIAGYDGADFVDGGSGNDYIFGGAGNDDMFGGSGNDTVSGSTGDDDIEGASGADRLSGGSGFDTFVYSFAGDSTATLSGRDVITDFQRGFDLIDLRAIDADVNTSGKQSFDFIGTAGFSGFEGELRYRQGSNYTVLEADRNGNGAADFAITFSGILNLSDNPLTGDILI